MAFNDVMFGLDTEPQQNSSGGGGGVRWAATGRCIAAGGGGGGPVDEELKEGDYDEMLEELESQLFYAEDGLNEDSADVEDTNVVDDEEDDRDPDVLEVFEVEHGSTEYFAMFEDTEKKSGGGGPTDNPAMFVDDDEDDCN